MSLDGQQVGGQRAHGQRAVLITGAGGGIGAASTRALAGRGFRVYAGVRNPDTAAALDDIPGVRVLQLDVTSSASITRAADEIDAGGVPLHGVVNNAGLIVQGPLELLPPDELRWQFEVNTIGPALVTQAMLPLLRRDHGRVVNISAPTARVPGPFFGPISASKAALEALSHVQRVELMPWGIPVVVVVPGAMATEIFAKAAAAAQKVTETLPPERVALYSNQVAAVEKALGSMRQGSPDSVAAVIVRALTAARPKLLYSVGPDTRLIGVLSRLPLGTRDRLLMRVTGLSGVTPARA